MDNVFSCFKASKRYGWCLSRLNDCKKGKTDAFIRYKITRKVFQIYLDIKLQETKFHWCVQRLKCVI